MSALRKRDKKREKLRAEALTRKTNRLLEEVVVSGPKRGAGGKKRKRLITAAVELAEFNKRAAATSAQSRALVAPPRLRRTRGPFTLYIVILSTGVHRNNLLVLQQKHNRVGNCPRTRDIHIRCRRVPLAEVHCSVSENFPLVWANENRELSVGVAPACGAAEVDEFATLPTLRSFWGWLGFERKCQGAGFQMRGM